MTLDDIFAHCIPEPNSGCWLWTDLSCNAHGYSQIERGGKKLYVHRLAYELAHDIKIPATYHVCHHCDVRSCCNPAHLFLGIHLDNMHDATRKGRRPLGERNGLAKLEASQILAIRADGRSNKQIAQDYGLSARHVWAVKERKQWKHL